MGAETKSKLLKVSMFQYILNLLRLSLYSFTAIPCLWKPLHLAIKP